MKTYDICAFGLIVSKRLLELKRPRKWIEQECSVQQSALSRYLRGASAPPAVLLYNIAKLTGVDPVELLEAVAEDEHNRNR